MIDRASLPDFELPATGNQRFQLSALKGHPFELDLRPRLSTSGCTVERTLSSTTPPPPECPPIP